MLYDAVALSICDNMPFFRFLTIGIDGRSLALVAALLGGALPCPTATADEFERPLLAGPLTDVVAVGEVEEPVNFMADQLSHDDQNQLVIATGHVEFVHEGRVLKADEVQYNLTTEIVTAYRDVVLMEKNGDVHFADELELNRDMRDGYVNALRTTLVDGSRFAAARGERIAGRKIVMHDATYTPCEPCKLDPTKPPLWQLRAATVTHDNVDKVVTYKNARLEVKGVPIAYTPYFSHPDGTIKQKSGFLSPTFQLDSQNGTSVGSRYYWAIDPSRDATVGAEIFTGQAPRLLGEYRQRYDDADLKVEGSLTYSERSDRVNDEMITRDEDVRGHFRIDGLWDMNDRWRSGVDINVASDEQYFRQYDIASPDVIDNEIYAERFSDRDYAAVRALAFQDLRTSDRHTDQPNILPEAEASFYGEPGEALGGRWRLDASALGLERSGSGDDLMRLSSALGWQRRDVTNFGLVSTVDAAVRGDAYYALDRDEEDANQSDKTKTRVFPMVNAQLSYPLVKPLRTVDVLFEPIASVTLVTNQDEDDSITNEDSQDIQLDASNLFEPNRFPGLDRVEDLSRVTYGARTGVIAPDGSMAEFFLGQSYRFQEDDNPFPENSGLATQQSDIVGRLKLGWRDITTLDYGFQLGNEDLESVRHELDHSLNLGPFGLNTRYLYAKAIEGIGVTGRRQQIQSYGTYKFSDTWRVRAGANYDLGIDDGLRKALLGLDYTGQCVSLYATAQRNLTNESTGESSTELMLRLGLKNLGEFQTSGIALGSTSADDQDEDNKLKGIPVTP